MLYDPKWEQKTETKTPSLRGFIAWLETMPPLGSYDWCKFDGTCAVDQYFSSLEPTIRERSDWWGDIALKLDPLATQAPRTFGALLGRAQKLAATD